MSVAEGLAFRVLRLVGRCLYKNASRSVFSPYFSYFSEYVQEIEEIRECCVFVKNGIKYVLGYAFEAPYMLRVTSSLSVGRESQLLLHGEPFG